jgi:hypothetical protein
VATANGYVAPAAPCFHIASVEELDTAARASFAAADIRTTANTLGFEFASSYDNTTTIKIFRYIRTAATDGRTVFAIVIDFQYRKFPFRNIIRSLDGELTVLLDIDAWLSVVSAIHMIDAFEQDGGITSTDDGGYI